MSISIFRSDILITVSPRQYKVARENSALQTLSIKRDRYHNFRKIAPGTVLPRALACLYRADILTTVSTRQ